MFATALGLPLVVSCRSTHGLPPPSLPLTRTPDATFRQQPPAVEHHQLLRAPSLSFGTLANGCELVLAEDDAQPTLAIAFVSRDARAADQHPEAAAVATLTAETLFKIARPERSDTGPTDDQPDSSELLLSARSYRTGTWFTVVGFADALDATTTQLASALLPAELGARSFDRAKAAMRARMLERQYRIEGELDDTAKSVLYGTSLNEAHERNDPAILDRISLEQVRDFHRTHYVPRDSALLFAGPISMDQAKQRAESRFGAWTGNAPTFDTVPALVAKSGRRLLRLAPLQAQSDFTVVAVTAAASSSPDRLAVALLSHLLSHVASSGLANKLRHESALSYAWSASYVAGRSTGTLYIRLETDAGKATEALDALLTELQRLADQPLTELDLETARASYLAERASELASARGTALALAQNFLQGLPRDDLETLEERVRALTPSALQAVARRYFRDRPMAIVSASYRLHLGDSPAFRDIQEVPFSSMLPAKP